MAHTLLYSCQQASVPYVVHLDDTHIVEVRKQGEELGIYKVTVSGKKRGNLLPIDIWHS